jgi:CheY-like chemotaxis protein
LSSSNARDPLAAGSSDLKGVRILLVEDSWHVGKAMKNLLQSLGADVTGPAATSAEAERLISEHAPQVALVDISLREGEMAYGLIDRLHDRGVPVIVISGYLVPPQAPVKAAAILQKPVSAAQLLATLRPVTARMAAR